MTRLEAIAEVLKSKGVPDNVIAYVKKPQRGSTSQLYDKQWLTFCKFCRDKKVHPLQCKDHLVAEYLISMFERGVQPSTIKVHRAAILSVLVHVDPSISDTIY